MESTLPATTTLLTLSKTLNPNSNPFLTHLHRRFSTARPSRCLHGQRAFLRLRSILSNGDHHRLSKFSSISPCSHPRSLSAMLPVTPVRFRLECFSSSAASFASGAGGFGGSNSGGGGGGGGDGASEGGDVKVNAVAPGAEDVSGLSSDVIILDVGGMTCGGCAASVKRILESQPQVSSASVNLTTETAVIWPVFEAKVAPDWQKIVGDALAKHLTSCGFTSNLRGPGANEGEIPS